MMDMAEIIKKSLQLQTNIKNLIEDFEKETGVVVDGITIDRFTTYAVRTHIPGIARIDLDLKLLI